MVYKTERRLKRKREGKKIVLAWIPAHQDIIGNEEVDKLAKEATREEWDKQLKIPYNDYRKEFKETSYKDIVSEIKSQAAVKGQFYFQHFFKEEERYPWFQGLNFPRRAVVLFNRLRANHFNLNASLARKEYIESSRCRCGNEYEDINHLVYECSEHDEQRIKYNLNEELDKVGASKPDDVWSWLRKEELTTLKVVYNFIKETGRVI